MLIHCPKCGREISDKIETCIYCGYTIKENKNRCFINHNQYDLSKILYDIQQNKSMGTVIRSIREICNMSLSDGKRLYDIIQTTRKIPEHFECEIMQSKCIPKCPTCGSTNLKRLNPLFQGWNPKQFRCNNCRYEW